MKYTVQLIEGEFALQAARELLTDLLTQKINYHKKIKFSNEERFGQDTHHSEKRIKALMEEKEQLLHFFSHLSETETIAIEGNLNLSIKTNGVSSINQ